MGFAEIETLPAEKGLSHWFVGSGCVGSAQRPSATGGGESDMTSTRRTALWAGVWFAVTFLASIPPAALYGGFGHVLKDPQFVLGGAETRIEWGAFLELILLIANIAT